MPKAASAGYSGTPLASKLGYKPSSRVALMSAPHGYRAWVEPIPKDVVFERAATSRTDLVHVFASERAVLATALSRLRRRLKPEAALWVSWPKKSAKVATDITEDVVREVALPLGFVDIKVCAVNEIWSGLKLVVRKELRPGKTREPGVRPRP
jgi:hypothetical protein